MDKQESVLGVCLPELFLVCRFDLPFLILIPFKSLRFLPASTLDNCTNHIGCGQVTMVFHCMPALKVQMKLFMKSSQRMDLCLSPRLN